MIKIATCQGNDYTITCLLDYPYFKKYFKLIAIDLSKQQKSDTHLKAIQKIDFNRNLTRPAGTTMFFIIEEANSKRNSYSTIILFRFNIIFI